MTGAALLARLSAAGAAVTLDPDGRVRIAGAARLPAGLLDLARRNREALADALARHRLAAFYVQAAGEALAALTAPDPDLDRERSGLAAAPAPVAVVAGKA